MAKLLTNIAQTCADLTNIKNAIQDKGIDIASGTPSSEYSSKIDEVYEAGKQAEYDRFWDNFQDYGNRTNCRAMFAGAGWNAETFKPKYKIKSSANTSVFMFQFFNTGSPQNLDFREYAHLFDFSEVTNATSLFQDARMDYIDIDLSNATILSNCFSEAYFAGRKTHITVKISEKCTSGTTSAFSYCSALTHLFFADGSAIGASFDLGSCPLVAESLVSVVEHFSTTKTGLTLTVNQSAVNNADWSKTNYASWDELKAIRPNLGFAYR